jgi:hypothetical protein
MATYFVCKEGTMGQIIIVFCAEDIAECRKFIRAKQTMQEQDELVIYKAVK